MDDSSYACTVRQLALPSRLVLSLAVTADGRRLALASTEVKEDQGKLVAAQETDLHLWDAETGSELLFIKEAHKEWVLILCFSPDGKQLASGGGDEVRVWDTTTGRTCYPPLPAFTMPTSVTFSPDGRRLVATGQGSHVRLWDADSGNELLILRGFGPPDSGHYGFTAHVAFSPNGKRLAANGWDGTISVWNAEHRAVPKIDR